MTAFLLFLRKVPLWVWVALALLVAGLFYGHLRFNAGQADIQTQWDAQKAKDLAAAQKLDREYRAKEAAEQKAAIESKAKRDKEIADGKVLADRLTADLLSAKRRVRVEWRTGECDVSPDNPIDGRGKTAAQLQGEALGEVSRIGSEAEADYAHLVRRYTEAEKTCNTTEK